MSDAAPARPPAAITIVTYNSERYIARCLSFALAQDYRPLELIVVDNASHDGTREILQSFAGRVRVILNGDNVGFAAGQNQAIACAGSAAWILTLNPDVRLPANFVRRLMAAGESANDIGSVCGKLRTALPSFEAPADPLLDSTGIYFTPNLRHLDRGSRTADQGQYDRPEWVFGGTGAACLYRRRMIEDISLDGEFFDADFFAYREDADVAWRAQLLGWKCLYVPSAVAWHVRSVVPENRRSLPPIINLHSVKNRWLLRIKNMTGDLYRRHWLAITARDIVVVGGCLAREWTSLPGFVFVFRRWRRIWEKRRQIMARRRTDDAYLASWFSATPASLPADGPITNAAWRDDLDPARF